MSNETQDLAQPPISGVLIDATCEEKQSSLNRCSDIDFLVVDADRLHVWVDGSHYVGVGQADTIEEGDVFYDAGTRMFEYVYQVTEIDRSIAPENTGVEIEFIYPSEKESMEVSQQTLTGLSNPAMGYSGPPTLLTDTEYALLDTPELARARETE